MNSDLMMAVLSMDAYNRGYGAGLSVPGTSVGYAAIIQDSSILKDNNGNSLDQPANFYAVAYQWNGQTVVSFRGTDVIAYDAWNGYGTFFGNS
jgi:hypothetical protein